MMPEAIVEKRPCMLRGRRSFVVREIGLGEAQGGEGGIDGGRDAEGGRFVSHLAMRPLELETTERRRAFRFHNQATTFPLY